MLNCFYFAIGPNCAKVMMCERFLRLGSIQARSLLNMTQLRLVDILLFHLLKFYLTLSYSRLINEWLQSAGFETRRSRQEREPRTSESQWRHQKASRAKQKTKSKGNCQFHSNAQRSNFKNRLSLAGTWSVGLLVQQLGGHSDRCTH